MSAPIRSQDLLHAGQLEAANASFWETQQQRYPASSVLRDLFRALKFGAVHRGDLMIKGHFENTHVLLVEGEVCIEGSYVDVPGAALIVRGDLRAMHAIFRGSLLADANLHASGLIYGQVRDCCSYFNVEGSLACRGLILDEEISRRYPLQSQLQTEFQLDPYRDDDFDRSLDLAMRLLDPQLYDWDDPMLPNFDRVRAMALMSPGSAVFRNHPSAAHVPHEVRWLSGDDAAGRYIDDKETEELRLLRLIDADPLLARLIGQLPELPDAVRERLVNR